jgi:hypothetical protein
MAHSRPDIALPIIIVIVITQGACLAVVALVGPWLSAFLNFLEVTCGAMDVASLIIMAIAYRAKMISTSEQMVGTSQVTMAALSHCHTSQIVMLPRCHSR